MAKDKVTPEAVPAPAAPVQTFDAKVQDSQMQAKLADANAHLFRVRAALCVRAQKAQAEQETILNEIAARKTAFEGQIADVEKMIQEVASGKVPENMPELPQDEQAQPQKRKYRRRNGATKGKVGRPKGSGKKGKVGRPKGSVRARNEKPLREVVVDILASNKGGMTLTELVKAVKGSGYQSNTQGDFSTIVYQTVHKLCKDKKAAKDADKKYKLVA